MADDQLPATNTHVTHTTHTNKHQTTTLTHTTGVRLYAPREKHALRGAWPSITARCVRNYNELSSVSLKFRRIKNNPEN